MTDIYYDIVTCNILLIVYCLIFAPTSKHWREDRRDSDTGAVTRHIGDATPIFVERIT